MTAMVSVGAELVVPGAVVWLLFGLAMDSESTAAIAALADRVERLLDGDRDVTFPADRDNEIGRLSAALGTLQGRLQAIEHQLQSQNERQHKLKAIVENTNHQIYTKDTDGVYQFANEATAAAVGRTVADVLGHTDEELFDADAIEDIRSADNRVLDTEEAVTVETETRIEGEPYCFADNKYPYYDKDGTLAGVLGITHDITEQREQERELKRYREYTDEILDAIDDVFYVADQAGQLQRWNRMVPELTGFSPDELKRKNILEFFEPQKRDEIASIIDRVFAGEDVFYESKVVTKDGTSVPYELFATRVEDPDGTPVLVGIGRDISERKARERELRERERKLSTLIENVPGVVYRERNEPGWPFEFVSDGCKEITGYEREALESGDVRWPTDVLIDDSNSVSQEIWSAVENDERFTVTYQIETPDGDHRWLWEQGRGVYDEDGEVAALEGVIIDITERKTRQEELERTTHFLEQTQQIANVGGWEMDLTGDPPFEGDMTDELYHIHDLPAGAHMDQETALEHYASEHRAELRAALDRAIEEAEPYELEARFTTAEDDELWVRTTGIPVFEDGEVIKLRGALQDITEQKERELAMESLQDVTRDLLGTESQVEIADIVVGQAHQVIGHDGVAVYLLDEETSQLDPVAYSSSFVDRCGDPASVSVGNGPSVLWNAFVSNERTVVTVPTTKHDPAFANAVEDAILVPIGDYGVFVVAAPEEAINDDTDRLLETLVTTTETALERLESESLLRQRESELVDRNQRLRREIQINDIIRSIHQSLIGCDSQAEIESVVCERLAEVEHVEFAWIGGDAYRNDALDIRAWGGTGQGYLDEISRSLETGAEPAVKTARSGEAVLEANVVAGLGEDPWHEQALRQEFHSVVSVPLLIDDFSTGVLTVYANEPDAFSELEREVFSELGESIADSIVAVNTRQALRGDSLIELTLTLESDSFFTKVAQQANCQLRFEGLATTDASDESRLFVTATGSTAEEVLDVLDGLVSVTSTRLVSETDDGCLFEVTVTGELLPSHLARHGGQLRSMEADHQGVELTVDVPKSTAVREFISALEEEYGGVELVGRRDVERSMQTSQAFLDHLLDRLTDRQRQVLKTAYYAGFFEWPRNSTGEEVAEMLDISQPTVNRHLRRSQQRLLEGLFEEIEDPQE